MRKLPAFAFGALGFAHGLNPAASQLDRRTITERGTRRHDDFITGQRDHRAGRDRLGVDERDDVQVGLILEKPGDVER